MPPPLRDPLHLSCFTAASCLGSGLEATRAALADRRSGLAPCDFDDAALQTWTGTVDGVDAEVLPARLAAYDCRNNRLAHKALRADGFADRVREVADRVGRSRVGVFIGTTTSGIHETERAYRHRDPRTGALPATLDYRGSHNLYSPTAFVRAYLELAGPAATVSTACSSSAKVFAAAWRMIDAGLIDAAVVGGVDSLCLTTLHGFGSLDLLSTQPCRPYDVARDGISIGEAAAFALLERPAAGLGADAILLRGVGESSDAHHMSAPQPDGLRARMAMEQALAMGGVGPDAVGYINLHGTGTVANDAAEGKAVAALFGARQVPCSSTKAATGHALGAAGALEAVISALALRHGVAWAGVNTQQPDDAIAVDYRLRNASLPLQYVLSNSFGFGGTNCSLLLGRAG